MSVRELAALYRVALERHLEAPSETTLRAAYELGRDAMGDGISILDVVAAHHDALGHRSALSTTVLGSAGDLLREALSSYEMAYRGLDEARDAIRAERRQTTLVRRLSSFLADAALPSDAGAVDEVVSLVVEYGRELTHADCGAATCDIPTRGTVTAVSAEDGCESLAHALLAPEVTRYAASVSIAARVRSEDVPAHPVLKRLLDESELGVAWLCVPIVGLPGHALGSVQLVTTSGRDFREADEATARHLAEMAAAAVERALLYRAADSVTPTRSR